MIGVERVKEIAKTRHDTLIMQRTTWENSITVFAENLKMVDKSLLTGIDIDLEKMSSRTLMPSLYKEPFNYKAYEKEKEAVTILFEKLEHIRDSLIEKACEEFGLDV